MSLSRRDFMKVVSSTAVATGLIGCGSDDNESVAVSFEHGVASGDPTQTQVIIWTRVTTAASYVDVTWQVASDMEFLNVVQSGVFTTDTGRDFTVKVDVQNLNANSQYYYRFMVGEMMSEVGQTQTLPEDGVEKASMAVVSCANYPAGYFHVYHEILNQHEQSPFDVVLHLGDYIYEYGTGGYASEDAAALGREPSKGSECITLDDYRKRYAQYRQDADLQALHAKLPMIAVWDDHELANDTWKNGAENHQDDEGSFIDRRAAAAAAWTEWLPVRENTFSNMLIYRQFSFGNLVNLMMLDTRLVGRDKPLNYFSLSAPTMEAIGGLVAQSRSADRELLGTEQLAWLMKEFNTHDAKWNVLGQQVLMSRMELPSSVMTAMFQLFTSTEEKKTEALLAVNTAITGYLADPSADPISLPYNLDAWDGYYVEREKVYQLAKASSGNFVCLAGDTHNAWASELKDVSNNPIGVEFATSSVSSPGLEEYLALDPVAIAQMEYTLPHLVSELQWADIKQRGFMRVTFTADAAQSTWYLVSTIKDKKYQVTTKSASTTNGTTLDII
ncbi:twin-arginine translocation signal domain-containing protein [Vibrio parahaemolyticus]|uniref:alkaline phosphatase D family protein n=1 Tax=Vibrio parahaemolyticus TaxID=670 RepID=UPI00061B2E4E|nr:alkaline phosphatase D family protein [Vibrio parahaemolyticus]EGQ8143920.1 alkaline phosphatase D family protein [Vibrio parahaemolyticus]EGQ8336562.1 twin-arginine translocation signal domain-containing protein [Vibrio parahaemolyticus]EGQ8369741.1 twin-arginine translocation signal domain-containing protein [Vibrio parahaemolyticus]EGQ8373313.1 twin-arginine translocation signal domain-containing protein [Vibrio parahaemolyticus]EGQ8721882.1 twin-arginine translocation signal domain-cont